MRTPVADRFWPKVDKNGPVPDYRPDLGPCWLWTASCLPGGYGQIYGPTRPLRAHRVSYELCVGPIPDGLVLDHLCRVTGCVNPSHLEAVTQRENNYRSTNNARARFDPACHAGHAWTEKNTYWTAKGFRYCRECARLRTAKLLAESPEAREKNRARARVQSKQRSEARALKRAG